jgi:Methyltransferase small domain
MRSIQVLKKSGLTELSKRTFGYVYRRTMRKLLPTISEVKYAGIPISRVRKLGDTAMSRFLIPHPLEDIEDYEQALVSALKSQVCIGDKVVVVGGGEGVTAVVAAKAAGETGSVLCFEGSKWSVRLIRATAARNKVSNRLTVKHAIVGQAISVYGMQEDHSTRIVAPADLPQCDVLELDCEGAEINILRNMKIRPRAIVVESHGIYGAPSKLIAEILENLNYAVENIGIAEPRDIPGCEAGDIRVILGKRNGPPSTDRRA